MKFFRYIALLFYSYYSKGARRNVAYLTSILLLTLLIYIHILIVALITGTDNYVISILDGSRSLRYLKIMAFMAPVFFLFYMGIKEKDLTELKEKLGYDHWEKEFNHRVL